MSINTLTTTAAVARAAAPDSDIDASRLPPAGTGPLAQVANFIPTEILGIYVTALSLIAQTHVERSDPNYPALGIIQIATFLLGFVLTPVIVWCAFAVKVKTAGGSLPVSPMCWPWWSMFAATLSFAVWAAALPSSGIAAQYLGPYGNLIAGILVLVTGVMLSMFAPLFTQVAPGVSKAAPAV